MNPPHPSRRRLVVPTVSLLFALALAGLSACDRKPPPPLPALVVAPAVATSLRLPAEELLADYRRMIVVMQDEKKLPPDDREAVASVGLMLFHSLQQRQQALTALVGDPADTARAPPLEALLEVIENEPGWFDADRLAFQEFLAEISLRYGQSQSLAGLRIGKRAAQDLLVLGEIEGAYDRELKDVFGRFATRGIEPKREKWADYIAKLRMLYSREGILKSYGVTLGNAQLPEPLPTTRGRPVADQREIFGAALPPKTLVLTFDDGPHGRHTDAILEILKRYGAPAIFFELGQNLRSQGAVAHRVLADGHQLANHSFSHGQMPRMSDAAVLKEVHDTEILLDATGRHGPGLFRFPYGARNEATLANIESQHLRSMMWTVDSLDWADPVPRSIADRVLGSLEKAQRGVVLFHDIQARTVLALPLVLDQLVADGWRFASWQNGAFVLAPIAPGRVAPEAALAASGGSLYRESHALVIGIDRYAQWPALNHAVADARAMQQTLVERFGFKPEHVTTLFDGEATRANILRALNERLTDPANVRRDDRVLVFFAGHGSTRKLASGRDVGYLVPADAPTGDLASGAISMPQLQEAAEALSAKHVLFLLDACYSGLGLTRGGAPPASRGFLDDNARRVGRQMMTAGGADQQVSDDGPGGHSVFTWTVLQALAGQGDLNGDGTVTGTELAAYVAPAVAAIARQTPAFGSLPGSQGGEFVFQMPVEREALSSDSRQLDPDAALLRQRIDKLLPATPATAVTVHNLEGGDTTLRLPVAQAASPPSPRMAAQQAHDQGLRLYRERRYDEAETAFTEALRLQPRFALAANNLGFVFYKRGQPVEAARWFQKAIDMDASRSLAWLNLGDARLRAGEDSAARFAYTRFTGLSPQHPRSAGLAAWVAAPDLVARPVPPTGS
jgi:peptidoglycan/xylan/chitin deacetylase (PgdA/CDA1 family)/uncharacterized caspase-like protein